MDYLIVILLVLLSGLFSGLTLGLLSLDKSDLERKISLGNKAAKKVYAVRKRGNLLLCTLLLGNVAVNSTLAIFLGNIASGLVAGISATALILIFGEIIPQATFARYALQVGAKTAWLVKIFIVILAPICLPIAWVLDKALGEEVPTIYSKKELMKIVEQHEDTPISEIDEDEERIIRGALSYSEKTAQEIMTPRSVVFSLEEHDVLDQELLEKIKKQGFTRIPVYRGEIDKMVGVLYSKNLINIDFETKGKDACKKGRTVACRPEMKLDELLNKFIESKTHLAFVLDDYKTFEGVVTLEDVLEEILKIEIVDESDRTVDLQELARKKEKHN